MALNKPNKEPRLRRGAFAALVVVGIAAASAILLAPAGRSANAAGDRCGVPGDIVALDRPLPHVAARIAEGGTLTIVALGSSSTYGTGASAPDRSYPSRLAVTLAARLPGLKVRVLNRGVGGEEAAAMAARIDRDVLADKPDLVIWQVGTNGVLQGDDANRMGEVVRAGIAKIEAAGADVMLMNPQYAPAMLRHKRYRSTLQVLDAVAYEADVPLFPRFAIMRHWAEDGRMPLDVMLTKDRLHMSDAGYDCLARQLAASLDSLAAPKPVEARAADATAG
jgi:lysophospholipase L1-like esterase